MLRRPHTMQRRSKTVAFIQDGTLLYRERMMDLRQMKVVVAVADMGGFAAAARRLHVVQSAVSGTVRTLERELGTLLFDRTTHRVALTPAGEAFVPAARAALRAAELAREAVNAVQGQLRGRVTVGTMQGVWEGPTMPWPRCARSIRAWSCSRDRRRSPTSGRHCARARWPWPWWRSTAGSSAGRRPGCCPARTWCCWRRPGGCRPGRPARRSPARRRSRRRARASMPVLGGPDKS